MYWQNDPSLHKHDAFEHAHGMTGVVGDLDKAANTWFGDKPW
jgi:hypothetical protein